MQATDVTRHTRITQQPVSSTTALSFICCSQFACKKKVARDFRYDPRKYVTTATVSHTYSDTLCLNSEHLNGTAAGTGEGPNMGQVGNRG